MPSFALHVRWRRARAILVALLLPALTLGGVPVGMTCCGFGLGTCRCGADNSADRSTGCLAAAASPNKVRACCRVQQGHCPGCCARNRSKPASGPISVVARRSGQAPAADCCSRVSAKGKHAPSRRCCCVKRGDLDLPKQAGPLRASVSERAVHQNSGFLRIDQCVADEFGCRWNSALGRPGRANGVIALCRLVI